MLKFVNTFMYEFYRLLEFTKFELPELILYAMFSYECSILFFSFFILLLNAVFMYVVSFTGSAVVLHCCKAPVSYTHLTLPTILRV